MGIHTNRSFTHYCIDNMKIYDPPLQVELGVELYEKLSITWAELKRN